MAERIDIDVSQALADIAKLKGGISDLKTQIGQVDKAADAAFDEGFATGMVDAINDLQNEYNELKRSADVLKNALKSATDPALIKLYAQNIAVLESGMKRLETTGKAAGVGLKEMNKSAETGKQVFENFFGTLTKATVIIAVIEQVLKFAKQAITLADNTDRATKSFGAFLGSADKAGKVVSDLSALAGRLSFPADEILGAGKALLGMGENVDNLVPLMERLAAISRGSGKDFGELATIYGKARTSGVLFAEDINQLVDAGIPVIQEFGKQFGLTGNDVGAQVKKMASEGKISFEELELAFFSLASSGGVYAGQAEAGIQAADRFNAAWTNALTNIGTTLKPAWDFTLNSLTDIIEKTAAIGDSKGFADYGKKILDFAIAATPGLTMFIKQMKEAFGINKDQEVANFDLPDPFFPQFNDGGDKSKLEQDAAKKRNELNDKTNKEENAKRAARRAKEAQEAKQAQEELSNARINGMKDGEAKELAIEQLRYKELTAQLEKYQIDTTEATEQHQKNIQGIEVKYALKRLADEQELLDMRKAQAEYEAAQAGANVEKQKKALEEIKAVRESEIDLTEAQQANLIKVLEAGGASKEAIAELQLKFDKEVQTQRLQNNIDFQKGLLAAYAGGDAATIKLIENQIALLETQLAGIKLPEPKDKPGDKGDRGILGLLGIDLGLNDAQFAELEKGFDNLKSIISDFSAAQVEAADHAVESAQKQIEAAQSVVDEQKRLSELGFANNLTDAQKNLEAAKAQEAKALEQKKKAAKQQAAIDTATQISSLITASAQTFKQFPGALTPIAIGLVALMFGAFFASKARAAQAAKFKHGGGGRVDGDSIIVGASHDTGGVGIEAEGGEFFGTDGKRFGIVNKRMTSKHFDLLQAINKDDKGKMREALAKLAPTMDRGAALGAIGEGSGSVLVMGRNSTDAKAREYLKDIRDNSRDKTSIEGAYSVQRKGNHTRKTRMK